MLDNTNSDGFPKGNVSNVSRFKGTPENNFGAENWRRQTGNSRQGINLRLHL